MNFLRSNIVFTIELIDFIQFAVHKAVSGQFQCSNHNFFRTTFYSSFA